MASTSAAVEVDDDKWEDPSLLTKPEASLQIKGPQSYYYWHADSERRRANDEKPVPVPLPHKLATTVAEKEKKIKSIETFSLCALRVHTPH